MSVVVEGDKVTIVFIDARSGNDGASKITANVFGKNLNFWITFPGLGIDVKSVLVFFVAGSLNFFEGGTKLGF